jgi:plasmid stabilization system protein ParE
MKRVVLTAEATAELEGAVEWYEERATGLGLEFLHTVDGALHAIAWSPDAFARWERDDRFRKFVVRRFPYVVFYREAADQIDVVAIAHGARRPGYWRKRR